MSAWSFFPWPRDYPGPWTGVWVESVGTRDCTRHNSNADPAFLCLHLLTAGRLRFVTEMGADVILGHGDLFTVWPHVPCRLEAVPPSRPEGVRMYWLRLRGPMRGDLAAEIGTPFARPWGKAADPARARRALTRLIALAREYPPNADILSAAELYRLAAACAPPAKYTSDGRSAPSGSRGMRTGGRAGPAGRAQDERPLAWRIREAMGQHAASGMNVSDFAKAFRMSRTKLFLLFRETFGRSPVKVLTDMRLECARDLLRKRDLSVKEVAASSGFKDPLYFSRIFRKRFGVPPGRFREEMAAGTGSR